MKGPLEYVAFCALENRPIAMLVSGPLAMDWVGEMIKVLVMGKGVQSWVLGCAREFPRRQCGNDRFAVRPPKFHIVPVLLDGKVMQVPGVEKTANFAVQPRSNIQSNFRRLSKTYTLFFLRVPECIINHANSKAWPGFRMRPAW